MSPTPYLQPCRSAVGARVPTPPCPQCQSPAFVVESRLCKNGSRRRRIKCGSCGFRWTLHIGTPPTRNGAPLLSAGEDARILSVIEALASELCCSPKCIALAIRRLSKGWPVDQAPIQDRDQPLSINEFKHEQESLKTEKQKNPSCRLCQHRNGKKCTFGYPEFDVDGYSAARYCNSYRPAG